uniref:Retrotransposon gag domain-containing protein n=1 Tax=Tanacetum cinerariifolium TaxID=118510 RepID=A0A6L2KTZ3_TANCI|nr:hypothetical protein [Tanacetum cinerariifolium]
MADNRTMVELLQAPTEGYEDAIVFPEIVANNFKLKHGLINLVQNKQFFGHDKEDPHAHIRYFNKITSTIRFFPPSKTTNLRNEITRFQQRFDESFYEAWDRFNDLLRACPHHGFSELHQLDTFYNALNVNDQDSLNSAAGENFLDKMPRECLKIIMSKSKVRQSRAKAVVAKVSTSSSTPAISSKVAELKDMVRALLLDKKNQSSALAHSLTPTPVKVVEPNCVTCGGAHSYQNCPATNENVYRDNIKEDPDEASITIKPTDTKSKDKEKGKMVEDPKPIKKKQQVELDEEYARKLHEELNKDIDWDNKDIDWDTAIDHIKQKAKEDLAVQRYQVMKKRPQTEGQARKNMMMYLKNVAGFRLDYFKGMSYDDIPKRKKLNEAVAEHNKHLEIVPDEDDDVFTEATPLARKVLVVDYSIIFLNNKPHYKIVKANGTHQLYISFLTLLKNFDRDDLESLWSIVKKRFSTTKPDNFTDDFLLTTLRAMFEEADDQAQIWKNQRTVHGQARVKSWKLLESCGVHIVTLSTIQLILLVERKYPLSRYMLDQMLNEVKLRVKERSEMSLELLSFRVDAAKELKEKHQVFNAAGEELGAAKQKLMMLD